MKRGVTTIDGRKTKKLITIHNDLDTRDDIDSMGQEKNGENYSPAVNIA